MTFTEDDASHMQFPYNDPLVVTLQIANRTTGLVYRFLVDTESSVNMIYKATLDKIGLAVTDIQARTTTLYGFNGEGVACIGAVSLVVTFGEYPLSVTKMMEFMVVNTTSTYNAILGRPILIGQGAVASVRHLAIKFPTSKGIGIIRGDRLAARECYDLLTRGKGNAVAQTLVLVADAEKADAKLGTREGEAIQTLMLVTDAEKANAKAGI